MGATEQEIIKEVMQRTNSELMLFFILLLVAMVVVWIPLYRMMRKDRIERVKLDFERERSILDVVTANTDVISELKTTMGIFSKSTNSSFSRIHDRIDQLVSISTVHGNTLARLQATLDEYTRNTKERRDSNVGN